MNALTVEGLTKQYPGFTLDSVSFSISEGRIMGLIGRNGAGKTTTLKSILNMITPQRGHIQILGHEFPAEERACKQMLGVVLGRIDFYTQKKLSYITSVARRFYEHWDGAQYERYMRGFGLDDGKRVKELSAGMRVKYLIALALSHGARLLVLDEPTSGLDPVSREELLELFRRLAGESGMSILFSTHITSDLEKCADDITYLKNGTVRASAEKNEFIEHFQNTTKKTNKNGAKQLEELSRFKNKVEKATQRLEEEWNDNPDCNKIRSESWAMKYPEHSYKYLCKSFKRNWENHIASYNKYKGNKQIGIFMVEYSDLVLTMYENVYTDWINCMTNGDFREPEKVKFYRLTRDKNLLEYIYSFKEDIKYVFFVYGKDCEIIKLESIPYLLKLMPWEYTIAPYIGTTLISSIYSVTMSDDSE